MMKVIKYSIILGVVLATVMMLFYIHELVGTLSDAETYENVWAMGKDAPHFQFRSIENYRIMLLGKLALGSLYMYGAIRYLRSPDRKLGLALLLSIAIFLAVLIRFWLITHYQGYYPDGDPYFL